MLLIKRIFSFSSDIFSNSDSKLDNILFFDEINPDEVPSLLKMCHVGLISLDLRHKSHNIPGKFLSYLQAGLPVLAKINPGTDLQNIIEKEKNKSKSFFKVLLKSISNGLDL